MTSNNDYATIKPIMARSKLQIDADPAYNWILNKIAGDLSFKAKRNISQREVVLKALAFAYGLEYEEIMTLTLADFPDDLKKFFPSDAAALIVLEMEKIREKLAEPY